MNLVPFAILTFCIHQISAQENVRSGDFVKSPRRLSSDSPAINLNSNAEVSQRKVSIDDTPDLFEIKKPTTKDKAYDDFLSFLYRNDKAKSKVKREISSDATVNGDLGRGKRMLVFRPLFVYKQQEIKRQKVNEKKQQTKKAVKPTKRSQG